MNLYRVVASYNYETEYEIVAEDETEASEMAADLIIDDIRCNPTIMLSRDVQIEVFQMED